MPNTVGVRELKTQASRVIRAVREEMAEYVITLRGRPVAMLRPLTEEEVQRLRQVEIGESLAERCSNQVEYSNPNLQRLRDTGAYDGDHRPSQAPRDPQLSHHGFAAGLSGDGLR